MEKVILGLVRKSLRNNTVIGHSQQEFTPGKQLVDLRKPVVDFSKAFDANSHNILLDIMLNTQLDKSIIC